MEVEPRGEMCVGGHLSQLMRLYRPWYSPGSHRRQKGIKLLWYFWARSFFISLSLAIVPGGHWGLHSVECLLLGFRVEWYGGQWMQSDWPVISLYVPIGQETHALVV